MQYSVKGVEEASAKMTQVAQDLSGAPMLNAIREATLLVLRSAKMNAPVDTGRLRASIAPEVRANMLPNEIKGVVGSNVVYAPYMEFGTGVFVGRPPYFPPPSALAVWARRHGTTAYAVALAIYRRGGLKPRWYLQRALEENQTRVEAIIEAAVVKTVFK